MSFEIQNQMKIAQLPNALQILQRLGVCDLRSTDILCKHNYAMDFAGSWFRSDTYFLVRVRNTGRFDDVTLRYDYLGNTLNTEYNKVKRFLSENPARCMLLYITPASVFVVNLRQLFWAIDRARISSTQKINRDAVTSFVCFSIEDLSRIRAIERRL